MAYQGAGQAYQPAPGSAGHQAVHYSEKIKFDFYPIYDKNLELTNKGEKMGLDQYAGFRDSNGEVHENFYWRKHARLQQFFAKEFEKQKETKGDGSFDLGFNAGEGGVKITEELVKRLEEQVKSGYYDCFASDGFFWGQQFQEESVKEYKAQDEEFIKWCKDQLKKGKDIGYDCSW